MNTMPALAGDVSPSKAAVARERVAPWPHTLLVFAVLAGWAVYGAVRAHAGIISDAPRWVRYAGQMLVLWLMTGTVVAGLYQRRRFLRSVLQTRQPLADIGIGACVFVAGTILIVLVGHILQPLHLSRIQQSVTSIAPHTRIELALWMLVSASAGICEEFLFRGYLVRQLLQWCRSETAAVVLSAVLFGSMHLYEGTGAAIQITALGALFAVVALRRQGLLAVMVAHFLQDAIAGLALFLRH